MHIHTITYVFSFLLKINSFLIQYNLNIAFPLFTSPHLLSHSDPLPFSLWFLVPQAVLDTGSIH